MEDPTKTEINPLSQTLGYFSFFPNDRDKIDELQQQMQALQSRIETLERRQGRTSWWKRIFDSSHNV
jgi:hypothetical protein